MPDTTAAPLLLPRPLDVDPLQDGADAIRDLADRLQALIEVPWIAFPFGAGWSNLGAPRQVCQYRIILGRRVELRGVATSAAATGVVGTLPAGFRPAAQELFVVNDNGAIANTARLEIFANGEVQKTHGTLGHLSLSGVYWYV